MKNLLIFCLLFFSKQASSQILLRVGFVSSETTGHSVVMYYVLSDVDSIVSRIKNTQSIHERDILRIWGLPLLEDNTVKDNCRNSSMKYLLFGEIFKRKQEYFNRIEHKNVLITLKYVKLRNLSFCKVDLSNNPWGDYDVDFDQAALLTMENVQYSNFTKAEINKFNSIKNAVAELIEQ